MKRSVLSACAAIVQKEIEFYAGFTCLEYDVNDENTMRVAGTGIFRSIIYANENQPYSAIEQPALITRMFILPFTPVFHFSIIRVTILHSYCVSYNKTQTETRALQDFLPEELLCRLSA